jgi:hypothetical protein
VKAKSAALQGVLAVAGLVAAYVTWQRPKEDSKAQSVVIVDATKNALEKVTYQDGTRLVALEKKDRFEVTLAYMPGKRPSVDAGAPQVVELDGGADAGALLASVKAPEPAPDRTVYANDRADSIWAKLTPFEGTRALGVLGPEKLEEVGLTGSERALELRVAGVPHRFKISKPLSGLIGSYAQDEASHRVFLISSSLFNDLDPNSQLLVDRRLHQFKPSEFDAITIKSNGKEGRFVQSGVELGQPKLARATTPEQADELAKNWHDKIWNKLIVTEVLAAGETPKSGAAQPVLRLEYGLKSQPKGWLEIGMDPQKNTWARSENTPSWVAVHQGSDELIVEGQKLINAL